MNTAIQESEAKGKAEGKAEGLAQGKAEGLAEGELERLKLQQEIEVLKKLLKIE